MPPERAGTRKVKNAQEAHEAIRPAGDTFRTPGEVADELSTEEFKLYELIWRRTIASQMTDAVGQSVSVRIRATSTTGEECDFGATGKTITDPGFLKAYVESSDDADAEAEDAERRLPTLVEGQSVTAEELTAVAHTTQPPARYTEASLVKAMEGWASVAPTPRSCRRSGPWLRVQAWPALIPSFTVREVGLLDGIPTPGLFSFTASAETDEIAVGSVSVPARLLLRQRRGEEAQSPVLVV